MFTVTKKPLTPNTLWDAAKSEPLCKFVKGVLKTNDTDLVEKLKGMGYEVTGEANKESDNESIPSVTQPKDVEPQMPPDTPDDESNDDSENGSDDKTGEANKENVNSKRRNRKAADK